MRARYGAEAGARSIRFGRLDRATARLDRARAETAIRAVVGGDPRGVWARGPVEGVELVAGRSASPLFPSVDRPSPWESGVVRLGRDVESRRIAGVAQIDEAILRAARHVAASKVPVEE